MKNVSLICVLVLLLITIFSACSDEEPKRIPKVTTNVATNITSFSVALSGEISNDGNAEITETGFVYSTENNSPTLADEKLTLDEVSEVFNATLEDLAPETVYYVKAYASNSKGTGYGEVVAFTTDEIQPTSEGLVAYYTFEDNTTDQIGSSNAVPSGTTLTYSFINDRTKKAVNFSSANYAVIDNVFDYERKTVSLWVKINAFTAEPSVIFVSDNPNKQYGNVGVNTLLDGAQKRIVLTLSGNQITMPAAEGVWYHLALVGNAKKYSFYLNGTLIAESNFNNYVASNSGEASTILGASRARTFLFSGSIDNLRIYNRALSAEEIKVIAKH